mmetsp:Transcript_33417/g.80798  ORF Transcript_33417/g.80798 Transcript_33417/m.80798 type:complete len:83 (+) Transcript_33417:891-1139(+)
MRKPDEIAGTLGNNSEDDQAGTTLEAKPPPHEFHNISERERERDVQRRMINEDLARTIADFNKKKDRPSRLEIMIRGTSFEP